MVAGQQGNLKIGAIIQARMASTRLPGKILMPLPYPNGKPLLHSVVEGIRRSSLVSNVIVATSSDPENDILETFCQDKGILLHRGSEENVLSRFVDVVNEYGLDIVVRLTGDNPIVDAPILDRVIKYHINEGNEYTQTSLLPVGMNFEVAASKAILKQLEFPLTKADEEHVTLFMRDSEQFRKGILSLSEYQDLSDLRLTIDYPSDFAVMSLLFSSLKSSDVPGIDSIRRLRKTHRWVFKINELNTQKRYYRSEIEEVEFGISLLKTAGMDRAARLLEQYGTT